MPGWLLALLDVLKSIGGIIFSYRTGKSAGRKEEQNDQQARDLDAIAKAEDAERRLKHDDTSVQQDPYNRDR